MDDKKGEQSGRRPANTVPLPVTDFPSWVGEHMREVMAQTPCGVIPALLLRPHPRTFKGALVCIPLTDASELLRRADGGPGEGEG